jgi:hypothetical protein
MGGGGYALGHLGEGTGCRWRSKVECARAAYECSSGRFRLREACCGGECSCCSCKTGCGSKTCCQGEGHVVRNWDISSIYSGVRSELAIF